MGQVIKCSCCARKLMYSQLEFIVYSTYKDTDKLAVICPSCKWVIASKSTEKVAQIIIERKI